MYRYIVRFEAFGEGESPAARPLRRLRLLCTFGHVELVSISWADAGLQNSSFLLGVSGARLSGRQRREVALDMIGAKQCAPQITGACRPLDVPMPLARPL